MKLASKLLVSLGKRSGQIVSRQDLSRLASPSHLSTGLNRLVGEGRLVRLGEGLYAKAHPDQDGKGRLVAGPLDLAREIFAKLGVPIHDLKQDVFEGRPVLWVDAGNHRVERKLNIGGAAVRYMKPQLGSAGLLTLPMDPDALPTRGVRRFVERFAKAHGVRHVRTGLDDYAEAVTRAAGDEVKLDPTGKLLIALKKKDLINGSQLARLMTNHMRELSSVRSVRGLRKRRLSAKRGAPEGSRGNQGPGTPVL